MESTSPTAIVPTSRIRRSVDDFVDAMVDDEIVFMDVSRGWFYSLRETGLRVWELIEEGDSGVTVESVVSQLCQEFEVDPDTCLDDLATCLQEMSEAGIVEVT